MFLSADDEVQVSVIVPVFNAMPYLVLLLDSLIAQDLAQDAFEVILVNDGSTDESPAVLEEYARRCANLRVIHQDNCGWPGKPRNVGLDVARGRYVFFADADDELGSEALRRMVTFADEHQSDVVVPKMVGIGGRILTYTMYGETAVDADMEEVLKSLSPVKLFRRSMLLAAGIRFPEQTVRLEDGMLLVKAYFTAARVSILADYDYYFARYREDGQNISARALDPEGYTWSVGEVSRLIREFDPDSDRAARIILNLYVGKCLKMYEPDRFARMSDTRRDEWLKQHLMFIERYIPPELEAGLPFPFRQRSQLVRSGDKAGLLTLGRVERGAVLSHLVSARWTLRSLILELELERIEPTDGRPDLHLQLHDRGSESRSEQRITDRVSATRHAPDRHIMWSDLLTSSRSTVKISRKMLKRRSARVIDVYVRGESELGIAPTRVLVIDGADLPRAKRSVAPYSTIKGNFSIRVRR